MKVSLIGYSIPNFNTENWEQNCTSEQIIYTALAQCYNQSFNPFENSFPDINKMKKIIKSVVDSGHTSVLSHCSFSFLIEDVSRSLTMQLIRHSVGTAFSQKSQRYTNGSNFTFVVPPTISNKPEALGLFLNCMTHIKSVYKDLTEIYNIPKEDARFVLPNATTSNIVTSMNFRALGHFFGLRLCTRAQWEIRDMSKAMSKICKEISPYVFEDLKLGYAKCFQSGFCEEEKSCGIKPKLSDILEVYNKEKN